MLSYSLTAEQRERIENNRLQALARLQHQQQVAAAAAAPQAPRPDAGAPSRISSSYWGCLLYTSPSPRDRG